MDTQNNPESSNNTSSSTTTSANNPRSTTNSVPANPSSSSSSSSSSAQPTTAPQPVSRTASSSSSVRKQQLSLSNSSTSSSSTTSSNTNDDDTRKRKQTLQSTLHDLRAFLLPFYSLYLPAKSLDGLLRRVFGPIIRPVLRILARALWQRGLLASNLAFDVAITLWKLVLNLFFREVRPRGGHNIPRDGEGPLIFVVAPHHNQFLDGLILMSEVQAASGRRLSFLTAENSMKRKFIGTSARLMMGIPVVRAQDNAKVGTGLIYYDPDQEDFTILKGYQTKFTKEFAPKHQAMLPKSLGYKTAQVEEIIDDSTIRLKAPYNEKAKEALLAAGRRLKGQDNDNDDASNFEEKGGHKKFGIEFKYMAYVDQSQMYAMVHQKLNEGASLGIFPEGGSHDRTDLLPLKAGVAVIALGAMNAYPGLNVRILPVGLSYFHPHKFRSRAVVEFGSPIEIPQENVQGFKNGGDEKAKSIASLMDLVFDGLKSVTVRAPDYETLMLIQAARRLYNPPDNYLSLGRIIEMNRRFLTGWLKYKDDPRIKELTKKVLEYNRQLQYLGLRDHQVELSNRSAWKSFAILLYRVGLISFWTLFALPGVILNAPMFIAAKVISKKKAKQALAASTVKLEGRDVLGTWKVLVSLGIAPILYSFYIGVIIFLTFKNELRLRYKVLAPLATVFALPAIGYSALKFGEVGMDIYKSLPPLFVSLLPGNSKSIQQLREMRRNLTKQIRDVVDELGPTVFDDFESLRSIPSAALDGPKYKPTYGVGSGNMLSHPLAWLDEKLFGWSQYKKELPRPNRRTSTDSNTSTTTDDSSDEGLITRTPRVGENDYEEIVRMIDKGRRNSAALNLEPFTDKQKPQEQPQDGTSTSVKLSETESQSRKRNVDTSSENQKE